MKRLLFLFLVLSMGLHLLAQTSSLEVTIQNVKDDTGNVRVALFNSEKGFTQDPWKGTVTKAKSGEVKVTFENIPAGHYAMAVYHDANENGKLDSNFVGIPKEGFGFSKDAMGTFGPPSFEKASFDWAGAGTFTIHLKYL